VLRRRDRLSLPKIRRRIAGLDLALLEALLPQPAPPPAAPTPTSRTIAPGSERWDHVTLLPGRELRVRTDAGAIVHRLAKEIVATYATAR
jgi:hypothetical protein